MRPSDKFKKVIWLTRLCAKACGADVADPDYKLNSITYLVLFSITIYFIFSIFTICHKFHEGWGIVLQSFCMVGSVVQGITKLVCGIVYKQFVRSQTAFLISVYEKYEEKGEKYNTALHKCMLRVRTVLKIVSFIYVAIVLVMVSGPVIVWLLSGRLLFAMQFDLPYVDQDTTYGYFCTMGAQITCLFFGSFGNFAGDMYMLLFFGQISLLAEIMKLKVNELNDLAEDLQNPVVINMLLEVIEWHQICANYIEITDASFFWVNAMQVSMSGLSMVLSLFIMFTGDWIGCYGYIGILFATMYMYCAMGTIAEVANDDITADIYDIHFYNMNITQQKLVGMMLMKSQSAKKITVGGVMDLSVSTGLQVTKTVYSIFMMLVNG